MLLFCCEQVKDCMIYLGDAFSRLDQNVQTCEATADDEKARFAKKVRDEIPGLQKDILRVAAELDDPQISDQDEDEESVVRYLRRQKTQFDSHKEQAEKYVVWRRVPPPSVPFLVRTPRACEVLDRD